MTKRVLIIGGYGNFGSVIAKALASDANIQLLIGGRSVDKAKKFIAEFSAAVPAEALALDIHGDFVQVLEAAKPDIVIHTTGPFQHQDFGVAQACIRQGCHYIDLADARSFVGRVSDYDEIAKSKNLLIVSGASSVPCLTAAVIDRYRIRFATLEKVYYGISAAQQSIRGIATASAVLSYVGEPFTTRIRGEDQVIYGWQNIHAHKYPEIGVRLFGNCDVPDLELFPARYPELKTIRFSAGHEIAVAHIGLWLLSWIVRSGIIPPLEYAAPVLLKISRLFDVLGRKRSGFHMLMYGTDKKGQQKAEAFYMIAKSGHGIQIPCTPAILLAKGLANGTITTTGARPCLDLIDLDTYCAALKGLDIKILKDEKINPHKAEAKPAPKKIVKPAVKAAPTHTYRNNPDVPTFPDDKPLFIFDGVCVLCSRGAAWLMQNEKGDSFRFASAQSPLGQALYRHYKIAMDETYLLIDQGKIYTKSEGYIHMLDTLGGKWLYLRFLGEIPRNLRDRLYDIVARNRYKWFGKAEQCELIPDEMKEKLLK